MSSELCRRSTFRVCRGVSHKTEKTMTTETTRERGGEERRGERGEERRQGGDEDERGERKGTDDDHRVP